MNDIHKNYFKFFGIFISCLLIRLIPFRAPNVEPIMATVMPFSKEYGAYIGFGFAFLSIILYDLITGTFGIWTLFTASTYGIIGLYSGYFFKNIKPKRKDFVWFAVIGTLFFDLVTGLSVGPLFFHQSLTTAIVGQIPFTLWHLLGNISFALVLSPAIYNFIKNENLENVSIINVFSLKKV